MNEEKTLPAVGGRRIDCSFAEMERRFKLYLMREQEKISPDNGLVAVLCDGVRLVREHLDFYAEHSKIPTIPDIRRQTIEECAKKVEGTTKIMTRKAFQIAEEVRSLAREGK